MSDPRRLLLDTRLDALFDRWEETYSPAELAGFHRDGAVNEATYYAEPRRVLVVQVEPNSRDGNYDRFRGDDLRLVFPELLTKPNTVHMAMFASMALDRRLPQGRPAPEVVLDLLQRFACINLKKLGGTSAAKKKEVASFAWRDRAFLHEQVQLLEPHLILASGPIVRGTIGKILLDQDSWKPTAEVWHWDGIPVIGTYHPSCRPRHFGSAVTQLAALLNIPGPPQAEAATGRPQLHRAATEEP